VLYDNYRPTFSKKHLSMMVIGSVVIRTIRAVSGEDDRVEVYDEIGPVIADAMDRELSPKVTSSPS